MTHRSVSHMHALLLKFRPEHVCSFNTGKRFRAYIRFSLVIECLAYSPAVLAHLRHIALIVLSSETQICKSTSKRYGYT